MDLVKERVAVKQDPLESLSIDNLERQVVVCNPVEEECSKTVDMEFSTQFAEKELIVRIIKVGTDELCDSPVVEQRAYLATSNLVRGLSNQHVIEPPVKGLTRIPWASRRCFLIDTPVEQIKQKSDFFLKPRAKQSAQIHFNLLPCRQVEWSSMRYPYCCHHALVPWPPV